ncbi:MAG: hypothetical protein QW343_01120 [Candidatus Norongarragalinales archaeon]
MEVDAKRKLLEKTKRGLEDAVLIIEGKRDERALRESGLAPSAQVVKAGGRNAGAVARRALEAKKSDEQKIVVLTDFDEEGERRASEIREALNAEGAAPDAALRRNFARLFGVACVEDAPAALARLEEMLSRKGKKSDLRTGENEK